MKYKIWWWVTGDDEGKIKGTDTFKSDEELSLDDITELLDDAVNDEFCVAVSILANSHFASTHDSLLHPKNFGVTKFKKIE